MAAVASRQDHAGSIRFSHNRPAPRIRGFRVDGGGRHKTFFGPVEALDFVVLVEALGARIVAIARDGVAITRAELRALAEAELGVVEEPDLCWSG